MTTEILKLQADIPIEWVGLRLDQALARLFAEHSRSRLKNWIDEGKVRVNGLTCRPKDKVIGGEKIEIEAPVEIQTAWLPEDISLNILFEDDDILILNKPQGLVVHPASGNSHGTLVNALLHYYPTLQNIPRAGIVHRLDKDTTGVMMVAKTIEAHSALSVQLQERTVKRTYEAVVWGGMLSGGTIQTKMGRHPKDRQKMAVVEVGKEAVTHYRVLERFQHHTRVEVNLETGRTHQIRVHMAHIQYPLVGDKTYGGRKRIPPKATAKMLETLQQFTRQALFAKRLTIIHPKLKEEMTWEIPMPEDMEYLLNVLRCEKDKK